VQKLGQLNLSLPPSYSSLQITLKFREKGVTFGSNDGLVRIRWEFAEDMLQARQVPFRVGIHASVVEPVMDFSAEVRELSKRHPEPAVGLGGLDGPWLYDVCLSWHVSTESLSRN